MIDYFPWENAIEVEVHVIAGKNFGVEENDAHQQDEQVGAGDGRDRLDQVIYHCIYYIYKS